MILVGNQRGGGRDLACHLLKTENEHVEVHEIRGFASDTLHEAFNEAYAMSRGTRCRQYLFSLSFNPPPGHNVCTEDFEAAIDRAESELGLNGQPRAVVFHEKEGRRHAHAVWSRIDAERMKAVQLSHSRNKLMEVSRDLYREHGWRMPDGMADRSKCDPYNFSYEEYQQAKRLGRDPRVIKAAIADSWAMSDSRAAFENALEERGFRLARGDRRGFVAVDYTGEPYAISKWAGVRTKALRERFGDPAKLRSLHEVRAEVAEGMASAVQRMQREHDEQRRKAQAELRRETLELAERQRVERAKLDERQAARQRIEVQERQARFSPGVRGLWNRLTGEHRRTKEQNEREAHAALLRDRGERDNTIFTHVEQQRALRERRAQHVIHARETRNALSADRRAFTEAATASREAAKAAFMETRKVAPSRQRTRDPTREP